MIVFWGFLKFGFVFFEIFLDFFGIFGFLVFVNIGDWFFSVLKELLLMFFGLFFFIGGMLKSFSLKVGFNGIISFFSWYLFFFNFFWFIVFFLVLFGMEFWFFFILLFFFRLIIVVKWWFFFWFFLVDFLFKL